MLALISSGDRASAGGPVVSTRSTAMASAGTTLIKLESIAAARLGRMAAIVAKAIIQVRRGGQLGIR